MKLKHSCWGQVDQQREIAPGLIRVHTPSHGGYWLSPERRAIVAIMLPKVRPFTGTLEWLEEDADWIIAAIVWPELFGGRAMYHIMKHTSPTGCYGYIMKNIPDDFFRSPHGWNFVQTAEAWYAEHKNDWEVGSYLGAAISIRQLSTGRERVVAVDDYPADSLIPDAVASLMSDYIPKPRPARQSAFA